MKKILLVVAISLVSLKSFSQAKTYYKDIVGECVGESVADKAMIDDIVKNCVKGKYFANHDFETINDDIIITDKIKTPILLVAAATWCAPCWGEVPSINKIAKLYEGQLEVIVLFWDTKEKMTKIASQFENGISLIPSKSLTKDKSTIMVGGFIHKLDYPAAYLISKDKKIIGFKRGAAYPTKKMGWDKVNEINEQQLNDFIKPALK